MPPITFGTGRERSIATARELSGIAARAGVARNSVAPSVTVARTMRPIGDNDATANSVNLAPASAPMLAPSMITTNRRWPLLTLNESAAYAHICATAITP